MSKTYLSYDPDQQLLLPAALQEWLPPDHLAYFISDVVDQLDLSAITARYEEERRGGPPYHPRMMVKVLLYGYCTGVASSRRIAQRLHEDIAFRVLAANNTPDFRTISYFRKDHLEALADLFLQVLELCKQAGLVKLGHVALDGTKVRANASKHKAMSYGRMKEKEGQLSAEVAGLLRRAGEVDDDEDRRYGKDKRGDELPEELAFRGSRLREIREAKAALEAGALAEAEQADREGGNHPGVPDYKAQRNFTDRDSRILPGPGRQDFQQSYNCQAVVDSTHQVIVAARATNATSDKQQAVALVEETTGNVGAVPREVSADAGYYSVKAVEELYALGANPFIAPEKTRHGRVLEPAPRGRIPKGLSVRDRMRRKLRTKRGRERYALRMETVEPVVGQIKQGRGFRQFLLRGLAKVNREWLLICAGHNLLKLFRFGAGMSGNVRGKGATGNNKESCQAIGSGVFERRPGYVHPHHAGFVATGESWPINRVSWSILRQAPSRSIPTDSHRVRSRTELHPAHRGLQVTGCTHQGHNHEPALSGRSVRPHGPGVPAWRRQRALGLGQGRQHRRLGPTFPVLDLIRALDGLPRAPSDQDSGTVQADSRQRRGGVLRPPGDRWTDNRCSFDHDCGVLWLRHGPAGNVPADGIRSGNCGVSGRHHRPVGVGAGEHEDAGHAELVASLRAELATPDQLRAHRRAGRSDVR